MTRKRLIVTLVLYVSVGLSAILTASAADRTKPNILLIMADDLGWRETSCYGSTFFKTPYIDRLAQSGMRFVNGYATSFFGKWHLGHKPYIPEAHGFDYLRGGRHHSGSPGEDPKRKFYPPWKDCETLDSNLPANTHVDNYITDLAIKHMKDMKKQNNPSSCVAGGLSRNENTSI